MKKIFIALLVFAMVGVTGCGNTKTLTCTMEEDGTVGKTVLTYKKDKLTKASVVADTDLSGKDISDDDVTTYKTIYDYMCSAMNTDGVSCKADVTKKKASLNITLDIEKVSSDTLDEMDMDGIDGFTMKEAKEQLVKEGYTCK